MESRRPYQFLLYIYIYTGTDLTCGSTLQIRSTSISYEESAKVPGIPVWNKELSLEYITVNSLAA